MSPPSDIRRRVARAGRIARRNLRRLRVGRSVEHLAGPARVEPRPGRAVVVAVVRDAEAHLPAFLDHYRSLGCRHIVLADNGSVDRTVELASADPHTTVLRCTLPFARYCNVLRTWLVARYCRNSWCLRVDADEFFDWPDSDAVPFSELLRYLETHGFDAVLGQLLDLFPEGPLGAAMADGEATFRDTHVCYDLDDLERRPYAPYFRRNRGHDQLEVLLGGIRKSVFGANPLLSKHPLIYHDPRGPMEFHTPHLVRRARVADVTAVLYHYKFLSDFRSRVADAVREGNYYSESLEYRQYARVLERDPDLCLVRSGTRRLAGTAELLKSGFLVASEAWRGLAGEHRSRAGGGRPGCETARERLHSGGSGSR